MLHGTKSAYPNKAHARAGKVVRRFANVAGGHEEIASPRRPIRLAVIGLAIEVRPTPSPPAEAVKMADQTDIGRLR